jgi:hypothetical protein
MIWNQKGISHSFMTATALGGPGCGAEIRSVGVTISRTDDCSTVRLAGVRVHACIVVRTRQASIDRTDIAPGGARFSQILGISGASCWHACARPCLARKTVMAGPITAVRYWRARGIDPDEAQFEAQTRFRAGAGENGPLQRIEEWG